MIFDRLHGSEVQVVTISIKIYFIYKRKKFFYLESPPKL